MRIEKIGIPLNFDVKNVNCFLILEEPITIIDPGPFSENFINILKEKLKKLRLGFSDIKRVILTHGHTDHGGMAGYLQAICGAEIYIHRNDFEKIGLDFNEKIEFKRETFGNFLKNQGFPSNLIDFLINYLTEFYRFSYKANEVKFIDEKDVIEFEKGKLTIIYTPGHTSGHICFKFNEILFSGDVLLKNIFVTPILEFNKDGSSRRNLENFLITLEKVKSFSKLKWHPGHDDGNFNKLEKINELKGFITFWKDRIKKNYNFLLTGYENFIKLFPKVEKEKLLFYISLYFGILEIIKKDVDKI